VHDGGGSSGISVSMKPNYSRQESGVKVVWREQRQAEETARSVRKAYRARYEEYVQECGGSSI
jgi:hypothetical protein